MLGGWLRNNHASNSAIGAQPIARELQPNMHRHIQYPLIAITTTKNIFFLPFSHSFIWVSIENTYTILLQRRARTISRTFTRLYMAKEPKSERERDTMSSNWRWNGTESAIAHSHPSYAHVRQSTSHFTSHNESKHCNYARGNAHIIRSRPASSIQFTFTLFTFLLCFFSGSFTSFHFFLLCLFRAPNEGNVPIWLAFV